MCFFWSSHFVLDLKSLSTISQKLYEQGNKAVQCVPIIKVSSEQVDNKLVLLLC